jgi:hypothetical protein
VGIVGIGLVFIGRLGKVMLLNRGAFRFVTTSGVFHGLVAGPLVFLASRTVLLQNFSAGRPVYIFQ